MPLRSSALHQFEGLEQHRAASFREEPTVELYFIYFIIDTLCEEPTVEPNSRDTLPPPPCLNICLRWRQLFFAPHCCRRLSRMTFHDGSVRGAQSPPTSSVSAQEAEDVAASEAADAVPGA